MARQKKKRFQRIPPPASVPTPPPGGPRRPPPDAGPTTPVDVSKIPIAGGGGGPVRQIGKDIKAAFTEPITPEQEKEIRKKAFGAVAGIVGGGGITKSQWISTILKTRGGVQSELAKLTEAGLSKIMSKEAATKSIGAVAGTAGGAVKTSIAELTAGRLGKMVNVVGAARANALKETSWRVGKRVITPTGAAINSKTNRLINTHLAKFFSKTALAWAIVGTSYVASVGFGLWGYAEAPEGIQFIEDKFLIPEAMRTEDWSLVDEAEAAKEELSDLNIWQKVGLWTPLAPLVGGPLKAKGIAEGAILRAKYIADQKDKQATGQTEAEYWKQRDEDEQAQFEANELAITARKILDNDNFNRARAAATKAERAEDKKFYEEQARFWAKERDKEREREAEEREVIAQFWLAYRKLAQEISDNNRPSNLNFGLL